MVFTGLGLWSYWEQLLHKTPGGRDLKMAVCTKRLSGEGCSVGWALLLGSSAVAW